MGGEAWLRGHWSDRLPAIDDDLGDMVRALESASAGGPVGSDSATSLASLDQAPPSHTFEHTPAASFGRGEAVPVEVAVQTGRWWQRVGAASLPAAEPG